MKSRPIQALSQTYIRTLFLFEESQKSNNDWIGRLKIERRKELGHRHVPQISKIEAAELQSAPYGKNMGATGVNNEDEDAVETLLPTSKIQYGKMEITTFIPVLGEGSWPQDRPGEI